MHLPNPRQPAAGTAPAQEDRHTLLLRLQVEASAYRAALAALPPLPQPSLLAFLH